jgi:hypothetical protein
MQNRSQAAPDVKKLDLTAYFSCPRHRVTLRERGFRA